MAEDEELFEVECFLNTRIKDGKRHYKVRWKGFPPEEDTWEPEDNVNECEEVLEAFWEKKRKSANRKQKNRRYRIMSEGEQQAAKTSGSLGDIEPLGFTRQASKELAMCLNKSRDVRRQSESSSHGGSDVTLVEHDVLSHTSSKSNFLSSQTGSDVTSSDNDVFSQSSRKSSRSGSDVLNHSTESATDVINVSSQESFNETDIEAIDSSPQEMSSKKKTASKRKCQVEVISLLSDSDDNEAEASSRVQKSPRWRVSRDLSPVIPRSCSQTSNSSQSTPRSDIVESQVDLSLDKVTVGKDSRLSPTDVDKSLSDTDSQRTNNQREVEEGLANEPKTISKSNEENSLVLSPEIAYQKPIVYTFDVTNDEGKTGSSLSARESVRSPDVFDSPLRRKNRFELSLKKKGKRRIRYTKDDDLESPRAKGEDSGEERGKYRESDEQVQEKTQLQKLKERMTELGDSKAIESDLNDPEIDNLVEAKTTGLLSENTQLDDVCPTITKLKGIMYKIAKKDNVSQDGTVVEISDGKSLDSEEVSPDISTDRNVDKIASTIDETSEKITTGATKMTAEQPPNICNSEVVNRLSVENSSLDLSAAETHDSEERLSTSLAFSLENNKPVLEEKKQNSMMSPEDKSTVDENLNDITQTESMDIVDSTNLEGLVQGKIEGPKCRYSDSESLSCDESYPKEVEESKQTFNRQESVPSPTDIPKKVFTSESTTRVLKNLRILAAKSREGKGGESLNLATAKPKEPEQDIAHFAVEGRSGDLDNPTLGLQGESGNELKLKAIDNENEREIAQQETGTGSEKNNRITENKSNKLQGLIDVQTTTSYEQNSNVIDDSKSKDEEIENVIKKKHADNCETEQKAGNIDVEEKQADKPEDCDVICSSVRTSSKTEKSMTQNDKKKNLDDCVLDVQNTKASENSISTDISSIKTVNSYPTLESLDIQNRIDDVTSFSGIQGDQITAVKSKHNLQKHSRTVAGCIVDDEIKPGRGKTRKDSNIIHEKTSAGKSLKRKKLSEPNILILEHSNLHLPEHREKNSLESTKKTKMNKQAKLNKKKNSLSAGKKSSTLSRVTSTEISGSSLENAKEESTRKSSIVNANFSGLTSGDLIGLIINEGDKEKEFDEHLKRKSSIAETNHKDPFSGREEEDMSIDDEEEDFDFELEDFPLEKLLQDEDDDINLRYIPSPPVEPLDVPFTSVKSAILEGDEATVRAALAGGLELDTLDGASGMTLLMLAAASGQDRVVELLMRRKADVDARQKNGMTALMHACEQGYPETAHVLLLCGADLNRQQIAGETALMKACKKGHTDVIEVLLKNGVDTRVESKSGHTARQFAARPYPELPSLIEEHEKRLGRVVEEAILKCLGDAVSLCKPAILSHRCIVPREGQQLTFPFMYYPQIYKKDVDVILFCIKAIFSDDVVSLLFGEENGIRGMLLNNKPQIPLLHGVRSIFSIDPKPRQNTITLQTHKCNNPASKLLVCIYAVQSRG